MKYAVLAFALALAACSPGKAPPVPGGRWAVLHPGQWDIDPGIVTVPPMPGERR